MNDNAPTKHDPFDGPASPFTHLITLTPTHNDAENNYVGTEFFYMRIDPDSREVTVYPEQDTMSSGFPDIEVRNYADGSMVIVPSSHIKDGPDDVQLPLRSQGSVTLTRYPVDPDSTPCSELIGQHKYSQPSTDETPIFAILIGDNGRPLLLNGDQYKYHGYSSKPYRAEPPINAVRFDPNGPRG